MSNRIISVLIAGCLAALPLTVSASAAAAAATVAAGLGLHSYEEQQAAIKALNDSGRFALKTYALSKAQCWLDVSFHEFTRNDRSSFPADSWAQSHAITEELKNAGVSPSAEVTPLVNGATRLREDLWSRLRSLQTEPGHECAAQLTACAEVELVHAGNEYRQIGWRHAKPYVQIVEDRVAEASTAAARCAPAAPAPARAAATEAVAPSAPPAAAGVRTEHVSIGAAALFAFNRRGAGDLLAAGRGQLDALAARLSRDYASVEVIRLSGHTDRLGSRTYNEKLALDRARTVKAYLESKSVAGPFETSGIAETGTPAQCRSVRQLQALRRCLQPDRRVDIEIVGVPRETMTAPAGMKP